jgi:hypothetical protein
MKHAAIVKMARLLQSLETEEALYHLLKTARQKFELLVINPPYNVFEVPKRNGSKRTIEDPADELQKIQAVLKKYLQALYYCYKTEAAYGYVQKAKDRAYVGGIYDNALAHAKHSYLLNIDLQDFFHFVGWQKIYENIIEPPFSIHPVVAKSICNICTFQGRLPMGAPTSPALSNIAGYPIDKKIGQFAKDNRLRYTRYVDDMSFSSNEAINETAIAKLETVVNGMGYQLKREKVKLYGPVQVKTVTGLDIINGEIKVPADFFTEVQNEIQHLQSYVLMQTRLKPGVNIELLIQKPMQRINGALLFIASVEGENYEPLQRLQKMLEGAVQPPNDFETLNWLKIGYDFF